jgi:plasmid stabilization system protein ParE
MEIVFRLVANADIAEARDWYNEQKAGLGGEFLTAVDQELERIAVAPHTHAQQYRGVRLARITRFPYIACYRIAADRIDVMAVVHTSRHPRVWRSRA